jgi:hypothetical protein
VIGGLPCTQVSFYWNRATREVSVTFVRGSISEKLTLNNDVLARYPVDTLHLVLYSGNANEVMEFFSMTGVLAPGDGEGILSCMQYAYYCLLSTVCSILHPPSSILYPLSSILYPLSSILSPFAGHFEHMKCQCFGKVLSRFISPTSTDLYFDTSVYDFPPSAMKIYNSNAITYPGVLANDGSTLTFAGVPTNAPYLVLPFEDPLVAATARRDLTIVYRGNVLE